MTTATDAIRPGGGPSATGHAEEKDYLNVDNSIMSWLFTLDHKRIGLMYLASVLIFFFAGGVLALGIRLELFTPGADFLTYFVSGKNAAELKLAAADLYNQLFTLHGAIMIFLFLIPSIPATFGNFFLPLMLGAKDVAFPRLNLFSFYIYVLGAMFFLYTLVSGGLDTGWTFYTPYSTSTNTAVIASTFGAFILGFSSILTGVNFVVTIHKMRAPRMTWTRMPLFLWALYSTSLIQILATPVLAITLLLLIFERALGIGIFDPAMGGDPVLYQHFFWFYSHPAVYIMILPAFGVISETISVHSRKHIFGYGFIAASSVAIAIIGFLVWGHHMFVSGQSPLASLLFSMITFAVAVPTAIKVFSWVATLYKGSIVFNAPMLNALSFVFLFTIGGLTGLFLATLATDVHLHDTYFVVAHFHYVMVGGTLVGFLAAIHHWWAKMFGRHYNEWCGRISAIFVFLGFNLTFFSQFVMGSQGMPRRYFTYDQVSPELLSIYTRMHQISTVGSMVLGAALLFTLIYLTHSLFFGQKVKSDSDLRWTGVSMEWQTATPPSPHNFHDQPIAYNGPYDFKEIDHSLGGGH